MSRKREVRKMRRDLINGAAWGAAFNNQVPAPTPPEVDAVADWRVILDAEPADYRDVPPIREQVLVEASDAVMGDRDVSYGGPEDSFTRIAALWNAQFSDLLRVPFQPHHIPMAMVCLKLARIAGNPTYRDGYVDGAGYFACGAEVSGAVR